MSCQCHLKQIGLGLQNYADTMGGLLPANLGPSNSAVDNGKSWMIGIMPFIENQSLFLALSNYDSQQPGSGDITRVTLEQLFRGESVQAKNSHGCGSEGRQAAGPKYPQVVLTSFLCPSDADRHHGLMAGRQGWLGKVAGLDNNTPLAVTNYKGVCGSNWGDDLRDGKAVTMPGLSVGKFPPNLLQYDPGPLHNWKPPLSETLQRWTLPSGEDVRYVGHDYGDGVFPRNGNGKLVTYLALDDVTDGTSRTFAIGEVVPAWCDWSWWYGWNGSTATCALPMNYKMWLNRARPGFHDVLAESGGFHSRHPGGSQFAMLDGSVQYVVNRIDHNIYRALATHNGAEGANLPE
jgi:prepilin-type processing-associated H-X9-DG protein